MWWPSVRTIHGIGGPRSGTSLALLQGSVIPYCHLDSSCGIPGHFPWHSHHGFLDLQTKPASRPPGKIMLRIQRETVTAYFGWLQ